MNQSKTQKDTRDQDVAYYLGPDIPRTEEDKARYLRGKAKFQEKQRVGEVPSCYTRENERACNRALAAIEASIPPGGYIPTEEEIAENDRLAAENEKAGERCPDAPDLGRCGGCDNLQAPKRPYGYACDVCHGETEEGPTRNFGSLDEIAKEIESLMGRDGRTIDGDEVYASLDGIEYEVTMSTYHFTEEQFDKLFVAVTGWDHL